MRRSVSLLTAAVLGVLSVLPGALPVHADTLGVLTYEIMDDGVHITGCDEEAAATVIVPETIGDEPVTSIDDWAFKDCDDITGIELPGSVTHIGQGAFCGCRSLTAFTVPEGVRELDIWPWQNCTLLESVELPSTVVSISSPLFLRCESLRTIIISEDNPNFTAEDGAIYSKDGTKLLCVAPGTVSGTYTVREGVTEIGEGAFEGCSALTGIELPDTLTKIDGYAFEETGLQSVTVPEGVTEMQWGVFYECEDLTEVSLPSTLQILGSDCFYSTPLLNEQTGIRYVDGWVVEVPEDVTVFAPPEGTVGIATCAIRGEGVRSMILPGSLRYICDYSNAIPSLQQVLVKNPEIDYGYDMPFFNIVRTFHDNEWDYDYEVWECDCVFIAEEGSTTEALAESYGASFVSLERYAAMDNAVVGDVDGNGFFQVNDLIVMQKSLVRQTRLCDKQYRLADYNRDGRVDVLDLTAFRHDLVNAKG